MAIKEPILIDIVILSYAKNEELKKLTEEAIASCHQSENPNEISFNIVVIESNKELNPYQYKGSTTLYSTQQFGFHRYLNIGIKHTNSAYICLCNNDLIFHRNWASAILKAMENDPELLCASTFCPIMHKNGNFKIDTGNIVGYETLFSGWCFLIKRSLIDQIGYFDEKFEFWYADADFLKTLKSHSLQNKLIT
ncbi:MAG: glycosyltransferase, partial [Pedobacter sp.]